MLFFFSLFCFFPSFSFRCFLFYLVLFCFASFCFICSYTKYVDAYFFLLLYSCFFPFSRRRPPACLAPAGIPLHLNTTRSVLLNSVWNNLAVISCCKIRSIESKLARYEFRGHFRSQLSAKLSLYIYEVYTPQDTAASYISRARLLQKMYPRICSSFLFVCLFV